MTSHLSLPVKRLLLLRILGSLLVGLGGISLLYSIAAFFIQQHFWNTIPTLQLMVRNIRDVGLKAVLLLLLDGAVLTALIAISRRLKTSLLAYTLSALGCGLLLFLLVFLKTPVTVNVMFFILAAPFFLSGFLALARRAPVKGPSPRLDKNAGIAFGALAVILLGCLSYQINRPPAQGDEINFWYTATEMLRFHPFDFYLKNHPFSTYDPGYPLLTALIAALAPGSLFAIAVRLVPFFSGLAVCVFVLSGTKKFNRWTGPVALVLLLQLFFVHWRVHGYFFHAWSAKALVVLTLAALFNTVENGSHWLVAFGVAALAQMLKPPLSLLLPFYLLAALPLCLWLSPRENRRRMTWTFVALLAGSIAAQLVWHAVLHRQSKTDMYDLSGQTMAAFNPHIVLTRLLPYLASEYTPHLLAFVVTVLMGLLWPRQFAFPLLMVAFMSATILGIFSTVTSIQRDYQAGVRYLFQGFYGWQCYFLYKKLGVLSRCIRTRK